MLKGVFTLFFIAVCTLGFGQNSTNFGEIGLKDGTVLKGTVDFNDNYTTADVVQIEVGENVSSYGPNLVDYIKVNNATYISKFLKIDQTEQYLNSISTSVNEKSIEKHIFLRSIIEGDANLYIYKDSRTHYFVEKDEDFVELIRIPRYLDNGKSKPYNKYIGQLTILLSDCIAQEKINGVAYSFTKIKKIIKAYNVCKGGSSTYVESEQPFKINLMPVVGNNFSQYRSKRRIDNGYLKGNPKNGSNLALGIAFDFNVVKKSDRVSLYNEILYQSYDFESFSRTEENPQFFSEFESFLDVAYIDITNGARFNIFKDKHTVMPFLGLNITNGFRIKNDSYGNVYSVFYNTERLSENLPYEGSIAAYSFRFSASAGFRFKNLAVETRYTPSWNLSEYTNVSSVSNFTILLSYKVL